MSEAAIIQPRRLVECSYRHDAVPLDPALHARFAGREIIELMMEGEVPISPMWQTAGIVLAEAGDGRVLFTAEPGPQHLNFSGTVHGGWAAVLLDSAMSFAIFSKLPKGRLHTTAELSVRHVRGITLAASRLRVEGLAVHVGRRMATAEGRITDDAGKLYAHGATTCMILEV